jgi:type IV pilus biogenesis protein CpaD/CtpE
MARTGIGILVALALGGCATQSESEKEFGQSVRHVVQAQKANPDASANPDPTPIMQGDGARLEPVLDAYRTDTGARENVERDILIDISE